MPLSLSDQIGSMDLGQHVCLIYEDFSEQARAFAPFIAQGLQRNEACVYIVDDSSLEDVERALTEYGIDLESQLESGRLSFLTKRDSYLRSREFKPDEMLNFLRTAVEEASESGFSGFRVTGEMTWALGGECGCDRLIEYEAMLNEFFPGSRATAVCQYNRKRFSPEIIRDVLRTHPLAIIGDEVCPNLYYESPEIVLGQIGTEQRVNWMVQKLKDYRRSEEKLQDAIQCRDNFLAMVSHELKTPLTTLSLQLQLLERDQRSLDPVEQLGNVKQHLPVAIRQVKRLTSTIESLLDISRIETQQLSMERLPVDFSLLVEDVISSFDRESSQLGSLIRLRAEPALIAELDRPRMQRVISNLVSNALRFGEGKPIEVNLLRKGDMLLLSVKDFGSGISRDDQTHIFDKFYRLAKEVPPVRGLGLGLYTARQLIQAHGGTIECESDANEGTCFFVSIPAFAQTKVTSCSRRA